MANESSERRTESASIDSFAPGPWPPLPAGMNLNTDPDVLVYFLGLMGFSYNQSNGTCEIGFHCASPSHKLTITAYENSTTLYSASGFPNPTGFELSIISKPSQVFFYQAAGDIDRTNGSFDHHDFRWLIDLEHRDFYNRRLPLKSGVFRKRLRVKQGNFFTIEPTCSTFDVIGGPNEQVAIHVPQGIGLSLELSDSECVDLINTADGRSILPHTLCKRQGRKYEVVFANLCQTLGGDHCTDNDFHKNLDVVDIALDEKFDLVLHQKCPVTAASTAASRVKVNTDEAPCMGTGFGQGSGFPTFPPG